MKCPKGSKQRGNPFPNRGTALQSGFCGTVPNRKWTTDITEFNVKGQQLYLSACMDLYNREIISRRMARRPVFEFVPSTLQAAFARFEGAVGKRTAKAARVHVVKFTERDRKIAPAGEPDLLSDFGHWKCRRDQ